MSRSRLTGKDMQLKSTSCWSPRKAQLMHRSMTTRQFIQLSQFDMLLLFSQPSVL